jgi:hypothetical protein
LPGSSGSFNQVSRAHYQIDSRYWLVLTYLIFFFISGAFTTAREARESSGLAVSAQRRERNSSIPVPVVQSVSQVV